MPWRGSDAALAIALAALVALVGCAGPASDTGVTDVATSEPASDTGTSSPMRPVDRQSGEQREMAPPPTRLHVTNHADEAVTVRVAKLSDGRTVSTFVTTVLPTGEVVDLDAALGDAAAYRVEIVVDGQVRWRRRIAEHRGVTLAVTPAGTVSVTGQVVV